MGAHDISAAGRFCRADSELGGAALAIGRARYYTSLMPRAPFYYTFGGMLPKALSRRAPISTYKREGKRECRVICASLLSFSAFIACLPMPSLMLDTGLPYFYERSPILRL